MKNELPVESLGVVLRVQVLDKLLSDRLNEDLAKLELEWWEYDVLSALRRQGKPFEMSASEIAETAMLSPGALTNRIDRLIKRGFVTRVENPEDRRMVLISLTEAGIQMVDRATRTRFQSAESAVRDLSETDLKQLNRLLRNVLVSLDSESAT